MIKGKKKAAGSGQQAAGEEVASSQEPGVVEVPPPPSDFQSFVADQVAQVAAGLGIPASVVKEASESETGETPVVLTAERVKRLEAAALNSALAAKQCRHCGTVGAWQIYDTDKTHGRVRYIKCKGCRCPDQVAVCVSDQPPTAEQGETE